jgi:plastocyanin
MVIVNTALAQLDPTAFIFGDFSPECIRISAGAQVTFLADQAGEGTSLPGQVDFSKCTLVGGVVGSPDLASPFASPLLETDPTVRAFTFPDAGTFPYHCAGEANLAGAVIVDP